MSTDTEHSDLIQEVRYLARVRVHRLAARQLAALESQTPASVRAMKAYLEGRPVDQQVAAQARDWERRAWAAQERDTAAAQAGTITAQVHQASQAATSAARRVPEGERPAEAGFFLHEGRMYKVVRAVYGDAKGHLYTKRLDEVKGEWVKVPGMTSYLREDERMTEAQAIEYSSKLKVTPEMAIYGKCTLCGRKLTDETSIANKVGPGPHAGLAD